MSIPLLFAKRGFHPRQLFAALQGAWLEPVVGNIWQENTGVTPTTTGGQTIGLIADQSGGGNNATQATAANRPTYQLDSNNLPLARHDTTDSLTVSLPSINVRRNLLTWSEQFDNGAWHVGGGVTVSSNVALSPNGSPSADKITYTSGVKISPYQLSTVAAGSSRTFTYSVYLKGTSGGEKVRLNLYQQGIADNLTSDITLTADWKRYSVTVTATASSNNMGVAIWSGTAGLACEFYAWGAQLELGSTATDYQKITDWTSEAYSSNGSVYFSTPVGMSALHNQSMGTSYTLPALSTDIYSWIVVPQRLSTVLESRLAPYMLRKAGIAGPDYFEQVDYGPDVLPQPLDLTGAGWTTNGSLSIVTSNSFTNSSGGGAGRAYSLSALLLNKRYAITVDYSKTESSVLFGVYDGSGTNPIATSTAASGVLTATYVMVQGPYLRLAGNSTVIINSVSVRELKDGMTGQLLDDNYEPLLMG